jgi:hypothetical protein
MDFFNKIKNFAKSFFANKKAIVFAFLFVFLLLGFLLPKNILAAVADPPAPELPQISGSLWGSGFLSGIVRFLIATAFWLSMVVARILFWIAVFLLNNITNQTTIGLSYTGFDNPVIAAGWPIMRDFANMMVVIGFVVVGIAFTLRLESYGSKKVLINLIIAALLINFSLPICGIFIDGSNIVMNYFFKSGGYTANTWGDMWNGAIGLDKIGEGATLTPTALKVVQYAVFYWTGFFIIILFFFLFLFRYVALWSLVIFAPLAFVCYVFPFTKGIFNNWWKNFFNWCIVGIPAAFFLYLADKVMLHFKTLYPSATGLVQILLLGAVPGGLLMVGLLFSIQISSGIVGGNYAKAGYAWTKGKVAGFAKGTATAPARKAGELMALGRLYGGAKNRLTRAAEWAHLVRPGTATQKAKESTKKNKERLDSLDSQRLRNLVESGWPTYTAEGKRDQAAAAQILVERGDFDTTNDRHVAALREAQARGFVITREQINKNPALAEFSRDVRGAQQTPEQIYQNLNVGDIRKLDARALAGDGTDNSPGLNFIRNVQTNRLERAMQEMSAQQINALKSLIQDIDDITTNLENEANSPGISPNMHDSIMAEVMDLRDKIDVINLA